MPPKRPAPEAAASEVIKKPRVACTWPGCDKDFSSTSGLNQHIRTEHEKIVHACTWPGCDKDFSTSSGLYRHIRTEHEKKNDAHACSFDGCQKRYSRASDLKIHVQRVHENRPPIPKKPRVACTWPGCDKDFSKTSDLNRHIRTQHEKKPRGGKKKAQVQEKKPEVQEKKPKVYKKKPKVYKKNARVEKRHVCTFDGCQKSYLRPSLLRIHIKDKHGNGSAESKKRHACIFDGCQKSYRRPFDLNNHVQRVHGVTSKKRHACTFDDCPKSYILARDLKNHMKTHSGKTWACPVQGCGKKYYYASGLSSHMKSTHGTPDEIAEHEQKKLEIRQFLANKMTQGICNATKSCPHPPVEGSSHCQTHERTIDLVAIALKDREQKGTLLADSIQNPDEFALLLQRPEIILDGASKASLKVLSQGLNDAHGSARTFIMDAEWILVKGSHHVPLDITIMRLNGEVIVSTRVDWGMTIKDLEAFCKTPISQRVIRKVYGESDRTWGKTPEQIIDILQNAKIFSPDAMI